MTVKELTVKDLIKMLSDFDENQEIFIYDDSYDGYRNIVDFIKDEEGDPIIVIR